jgi:hypothetical protein
MGYMAAAAVVAIAGAASSYMGASKSAKAAEKAAKKGIKDENRFYSKWSEKAEDYQEQKLDKLYNQADVFDRFDSAAFGDTDTYDNLRKAQNDFSKLAAGDFSAFESQIRKTMSDALVNTVGSGSPIGSFAGIAADAQLNYRQQGLANATNLSNFFSAEGNRLLGLEFGVMDQGFDIQYQLDRTKTTNINNLRSMQASQAGVGLSALGGGLSSIAGIMSSYNTSQQNQQAIADNRAYQQEQIGIMRDYYGRSNAGQQTYQSTSARPTFNYGQSAAGSFDLSQVIDPATANYPSGNGVVADGMVLPSLSTGFDPAAYERSNTGDALVAKYTVDTEWVPFYQRGSSGGTLAW